METIIFDKAKYHFTGNFPKELDNYQGYVHTGFYIGWLVWKELISEYFKEEAKEGIQQFADMQMTAVKLYEEYLDGVFSSDELNEEGLKFTKAYFDFENGKYMKDFYVVLASDLPSAYHVLDTWENFGKIAAAIDQRYEGGKKDPDFLKLYLQK